MTVCNIVTYVGELLLKHSVLEMNITHLQHVKPVHVKLKENFSVDP